MPHLRKTAEIVMALYVGMFGAFVDIHALSGSNALAWATFDLHQAVTFSWLCMVAAVIHAFGIWLNGKWRWSPLIRVAGIVFGAGLFMCLAWQGAVGSNTAGYTYFWIGLGFLAALQTALRDSYLAWRGVYGRIAY